MQPIASLPSPGTQIASWLRLGRELGRGAVGVVFEADRLDVAGRVAVKMLMPSSMQMGGVAERFEREVALVSSLRSPHTIRLLSHGAYNHTAEVLGLPYMVMELLHGETLQAVMARYEFSEAAVIDVLFHILRSLAEAHDKGIVHRDLKPENIFVSRRSGRPPLIQVLDFGVAKAVRGELAAMSQELTVANMMIGTPAYMSPEQASGKMVVTPAIDVYAVGCIAYHMLAGHPPYEASNPYAVAVKHIKEPPPSLAALASPAIAAIIGRSLVKSPAERHPNARAFGMALAAATGRRF